VEKSEKKFRVDEMVTRLRVIKGQQMAGGKTLPNAIYCQFLDWGGGGQKGSDRTGEESEYRRQKEVKKTDRCVGRRPPKV
jgi:hypothetical protein